MLNWSPKEWGKNITAERQLPQKRFLEFFGLQKCTEPLCLVAAFTDWDTNCSALALEPRWQDPTTGDFDCISKRAAAWLEHSHSHTRCLEHVCMQCCFDLTCKGHPLCFYVGSPLVPGFFCFMCSSGNHFSYWCSWMVIVLLTWSEYPT